MKLVQKNHIRVDKKTYQILLTLCRLSKNLYNYTLYIIRQYYYQNGKFLPYEKCYHYIKSNKNFKLLPSQVAQQTAKVVDRTMKSFFRLLSERKRGNYNRPIHLPRYLNKKGYFPCIFPKDMFKVIDNKIRLSLGKNFSQKYGIKHLWFKLPPNINKHAVKEVRIIPRGNGMWMEIEYVYEIEPKKVELDNNKYLAIDLGVNNFATVVTTNGTAVIIDGRNLKSFNRWWCKEKARIQSIYDKQGIKFGKKMAWLLKKKKNITENFTHQASAWIIKHCIENKIGNIVIGEMKHIKQKINLGDKNNQNIQLMPWGIFKQKLKYKCERYGINFIEVNEENTSKTCCNCGYIDEKNRKHRGLFVCKNCNIVLNADINGAINIMNKVTHEPVRVVGSGCVNHPVRIRVAYATKLLTKPYPLG